MTNSEAAMAVQHDHIGVQLAKMRKSRGVSQTDIARHMRVVQSRVSAIEGSDVLSVPVLTRYLDAMGATLPIVASFPNGEHCELLMPVDPR